MRASARRSHRSRPRTSRRPCDADVASRRPEEGVYAEDSRSPRRAASRADGREGALREGLAGGVACEPGEVVLLENVRFNKGEEEQGRAASRWRLVRYLRDGRVRHRHRAEPARTAWRSSRRWLARVRCSPTSSSAREGVGNPKRPLIAIVGARRSRPSSPSREPARKVDKLIVRRHRQTRSWSRPASGGQVAVRVRDVTWRGACSRNRGGRRGHPAATDVVGGQGVLGRGRGRREAGRPGCADEMILDIGPDTPIGSPPRSRRRHHRVERPRRRVRVRPVREARASSPGRGAQPAFSIAGAATRSGRSRSTASAGHLLHLDRWRPSSSSSREETARLEVLEARAGG